MTFEHYIWTGTERLRCGYTTGSCAAMAAQAACVLLLTGEALATAALTTPSGLRVKADVLEPAREGDAARCAVRKDAGDDVDATDGLLVFATVRRSDDPGVAIEGGEGVGRVTRAGLEQPVGQAAINAVPRAMIRDAAAAACREHGYAGGLSVEVSVPGGAEVAARTFNPHLGIEGGISILGTTGIVEPKSLAALRDSIALEIHQHAALGERGLIVVPGNYGARFIRDHFAVGEVPVVACSNFIGEALDAAAREGFARVLLVGHVGKLVKVAGGVMDTHSRTADCRAEVLCAHAALAGAGTAEARAIMGAATTEAMLATIRVAGLLPAVAASLAEALQGRLERRVAGAYAVGAVVFDNDRRELCRTAAADGVIEGLAIREVRDDRSS